MSEGDRTVTLDAVKDKFSVWVDANAFTTAEGGRNADSRLVAPVVDGLLEELPSRKGPTRPQQASSQLARLEGHQLSTWTVLHQLRTCDSDCESDEHHCGAQKHKCGAVCLREKKLNVDTWKRRCWTDDNVTWKVQSAQSY